MIVEIQKGMNIRVDSFLVGSKHGDGQRDKNKEEHLEMPDMKQFCRRVVVCFNRSRVLALFIGVRVQDNSAVA